MTPQLDADDRAGDRSSALPENIHHLRPPPPAHFNTCPVVHRHQTFRIARLHVLHVHDVRAVYADELAFGEELLVGADAYITFVAGEQ